MTTINNLINQVGGIEKAKRLDEMLKKHAVPEEWKISIINGMWHRSTIGFTHNDLRTAIAEHDATLTNEGTKQLESDDCTDIHNHVSPSTRVVDL